VATARPQWTFAFLGKITAAPPGTIAGLPNVRFLGEVPYEVVPAYYVASDACWVPHRVNELTMRQSSLKVYEYLASGKPTLATPIPLETDAAAMVRTVASAQEMIAALEDELATDCDRRRVARQATAASNSWTVRFDEISARVAELGR